MPKLCITLPTATKIMEITQNRTPNSPVIEMFGRLLQKRAGRAAGPKFLAGLIRADLRYVCGLDPDMAEPDPDQLLEVIIELLEHSTISGIARPMTRLACQDLAVEIMKDVLPSTVS